MKCGDQSNDPNQEYWELNSDADEWTEEATKDKDNLPITNSSLEQFRGKRSSLLISHRLGTLRQADLIVVLDEGRVVETGRHDHLMTTTGVYARLFARQAEGYHPMAEATP